MKNILMIEVSPRGKELASRAVSNQRSRKGSCNSIPAPISYVTTSQPNTFHIWTGPPSGPFQRETLCQRRA